MQATEKAPVTSVKADPVLLRVQGAFKHFPISGLGGLSVRAVDGVAGLKADHGLPFAVRFDGSCLGRCEVVVGEARGGMRQGFDGATDRPSTGFLEHAHAGVRVVFGGVDAAGFSLVVRLEGRGDREDAGGLVADEEGDAFGGGRCFRAQDDRDGEGVAVLEAAGR